MAPSGKKPAVKNEGIRVIGRVVTSRGQRVAESYRVLPVCQESLECTILLDVNHHLLTYIMLLYFFSPQRKCGMEGGDFCLLQSVAVFCTALFGFLKESLLQTNGFTLPSGVWAFLSSWLCSQAGSLLHHTFPSPPCPLPFQTCTLRSRFCFESSFKPSLTKVAISSLFLLHGSLILLCTIPCHDVCPYLVTSWRACSRVPQAMVCVSLRCLAQVPVLSKK